MNKVFESTAAAVRDIPDGSIIMCGGFGLCGIPENLIRAILAQGTSDLVIISNNPGSATDGVGYGLDLLFQQKRVRKFIGSFFGSAKTCKSQYLKHEVEIEIIPQGTLAERIRAANAGIGGFYTETGVGTYVAEGKERKIIAGKEYLLEFPLHADFALIKAYRGDTFGNLVYRETARNFNAVMAGAASTTIAEVERLEEPGSIEPDHVHTPGIYVQRIVQGERYDRLI